MTHITADGTQVQLRWTSSSGLLYTVETSGDGEIWQEVETDIDGVAGETSLSVDREGEVRLIRVRRD